MAFGGTLGEMTLPEVMQFIAQREKTGKLTLTRSKGQAVIMFREGRIIYAASNSFRETLGNILVCRGLLSEAALLDALARQYAANEERRLGAILIEIGSVQPEQIEAVMRSQTRLVLAELLRWTLGFFRFEAMTIPERGEVEVDAKDCVVLPGFATDQLLFDAATEFEEEIPETSLREVMAAIDPPSLGGETTLGLLRSAAQVVSRGVLFAVRTDALHAIGQFGFDGAFELGEAALPLHPRSILSEAIRAREAYRGPLPRILSGDDTLVQFLGGRFPAEVLVVPITIRGTVPLVFYGDTPSGERPIGSTRRLEADIGLVRRAMGEPLASMSELNSLEPAVAG